MKFNKINNKGFPTMAFVLVSIIIALAIGIFIFGFTNLTLRENPKFSFGRDVLECRQSVMIVAKLGAVMNLHEKCMPRSLDVSKFKPEDAAMVFLDELAKCIYSFGGGDIVVGSTRKSSNPIVCSYIHYNYLDSKKILDNFSKLAKEINIKQFELSEKITYHQYFTNPKLGKSGVLRNAAYDGFAQDTEKRTINYVLENITTCNTIRIYYRDLDWDEWIFADCIVSHEG